jgi:Mrp family chromosome partitioning ATPase
MSLVVLASLKSSPGVTTTALALGAVWPPERRVLVAELDSAGGDLAARFRLPDEPGLLTLGAAARRNDPARRVWQCCQRLPGGLAVLTGPETADQARNALAAPGLAAAFSGADADVLADCGRLDPGSPTLEVARHADLVVLVARPVYGELKRLGGTLPRLQQVGSRLAVVLVGKGKYPPSEVASALGVEVLGALPFDPQGAAALGGTPTTKGALRRSPLLRYAHGLARVLLGRLPSRTGQQVDSPMTVVRSPSAASTLEPRPGPEVRR